MEETEVKRNYLKFEKGNDNLVNWMDGDLRLLQINVTISVLETFENGVMESIYFCAQIQNVK